MMPISAKNLEIPLILTSQVSVPPVGVVVSVSLSVDWAEGADAVGVTDSNTAPPLEAGRCTDAAIREEVAAAVGSTDSATADPVLPTVGASVESAERVGVTDSLTTSPVEPTDANVL